MKTINSDDRMKYNGEPNRWTYKKDLENNSVGKVVDISYVGYHYRITQFRL